MPYDNYAWWEVTRSYFQIRFNATVDPATLINENFLVFTDEATPQQITDPFQTIDTATDYSSIDRTLTLWWDNAPTVSGPYTLSVSNIVNFLGEPQADFEIAFDWIAESATPDNVVDQRPTREPTEVEDYSIKAPGWSIVTSPEDAVDPTNSLTISDLNPGIGKHHSLTATENDGKLELLFDTPIASNFISAYYFTVSSKDIKKGLALWEPVNVLVLPNLDSTMVTIYMPAAEPLEDATPSYVYSYYLTDEQIAEYTFWEPQKKYRIIVSTEVGL